jgi:hypothetical protein
MFVVMDGNAMGFIHLNVHPRLVMNVYITLSLISICYQLTSS